MAIDRSTRAAMLRTLGRRSDATARDLHARAINRACLGDTHPDTHPDTRQIAANTLTHLPDHAPGHPDGPALQAAFPGL